MQTRRDGNLSQTFGKHLASQVTTYLVHVATGEEKLEKHVAGD